MLLSPVSYISMIAISIGMFALALPTFADQVGPRHTVFCPAELNCQQAFN